MRDSGLEQAIKAAGGVASLARAIGIAQPSVSNWTRIPAERVLAVEAHTNVSRFVLRPDIYGKVSEAEATSEANAIDEIDRERAADARGERPRTDPGLVESRARAGPRDSACRTAQRARRRRAAAPLQ